MTLRLFHKATKLNSGEYYAFQVTAHNSCGDTSSALQWYNTLASVPSAPAPPRLVSVDNHSLALEWDQLSPEATHGSKVEAYRLEIQRAPQDGWEVVYNDLPPQ